MTCDIIRDRERADQPLSGYVSSSAEEQTANSTFLNEKEDRATSERESLGRFLYTNPITPVWDRAVVLLVQRFRVRLSNLACWPVQLLPLLRMSA